MVIANYYPLWGGTQRQLRQICPFLQQRGAEVFVLTRRTPGTSAFEVIDGVTVHRMPVTNRSLLLDSLLYTFFSLGWLIRHRRSFDVLHCYQMFSPATIGVLLKFFLPRTRVVVKVTAASSYGEVREAHRLPLTGLRRMLLRRVDAFLAVNEEIAHELRSFGIPAGKIRYLPNGVVMPDHEAGNALGKADAKRRLGLPAGPAVLFTGRLSEEKNLDVLLRATKEVVAEHPSVYLVIVGKGGKERNVEPLVRQLRAAWGLEKAVFLRGDTADVAPYLRAADIFVNPSTAEGLSNAVLEALAFGVPVIAGDNAGNRQAVKDNENGLLVEPRNVAALREALCRLVSDQELSGRLAAAARLSAAHNFDMALIADRYVDLYQELCTRCG